MGLRQGHPWCAPVADAAWTSPLRPCRVRALHPHRTAAAVSARQDGSDGRAPGDPSQARGDTARAACWRRRDRPVADEALAGDEAPRGALRSEAGGEDPMSAFAEYAAILVNY